MRPRTAELLRIAVAAGAYVEAELLLAMYRSEMQASWEAATSPEQRGAISTEVSVLLQWARSTTLAARSHAQSKLIHLSRRSAYAGTVRKMDPLELDA
jgi:hypothetical protein